MPDKFTLPRVYSEEELMDIVRIIKEAKEWTKKRNIIYESKTTSPEQFYYDEMFIKK